MVLALIVVLVHILIRALVLIPKLFPVRITDPGLMPDMILLQDSIQFPVRIPIPDIDPNLLSIFILILILFISKMPLTGTLPS